MAATLKVRKQHAGNVDVRLVKGCVLSIWKFNVSWFSKRVSLASQTQLTPVQIALSITHEENSDPL